MAPAAWEKTKQKKTGYGTGPVSFLFFLSSCRSVAVQGAAAYLVSAFDLQSHTALFLSQAAAMCHFL